MHKDKLPSVPRFIVLGFMFAAVLASGCVAEEEDDPEVSTVVEATTIPVRNRGCGRLYRNYAWEENTYLYGCGNNYFGALYRVSFYGHNVYHCFWYTGSQYVGEQSDIAFSSAQLMDLPVAYDWCKNGYPSNYYSGG